MRLLSAPREGIWGRTRLWVREIQKTSIQVDSWLLGVIVLLILGIGAERHLNVIRYKRIT